MTPVDIATVFCDLDGTLVDSATANFGAYREALNRFGVEFTPADFETTWGRDSRDFLPDVAPQLSPKDLDAVRATKAAVYPRYLPEARLNVPLYRLLVALKQSSGIVLVTTAKRSNTNEVISHFGLQSLFDHVVCGEDTPRSKPWPDPYLHALRLVGSAPESCITFEDSAAGEDSAIAAGIEVVTVGFSSES